MVWLAWLAIKGAVMRGMSRPGALALALLPVLAAMLAGCSGESRSTGTKSTPSVSQTAAPTESIGSTAGSTATPWPAGPGAWQTVSDCASEPASYRTVYSASLGASGQGPALLQRSDDCGATWTTLTPPALAGFDYSSEISVFSVFASPLNTQVAFLTMETYQQAACGIPIGAGDILHGGIDALPALSSSCQRQFVTSDGGATWRALALPAPGVLGATSPEMNAELGLLGSLRAQGARLYGVVTNVELGASGVTPAWPVASDDGGLTWRLADAPLAAQGWAVWDFAPTPSGSTIYVTAEPVNDPARQPPTYGATLSIWASQDGGGSWTRESSAPGSASGRLVSGMAAGITPSGQRMLYLMTAGQTKQDTAMAVLGSVDDGAIWQGDQRLTFLPPADPMLGYPNLVGVLPDGEVVAINPYDGAPVMAWAPGEAPRAVAAPIALFPYENPVYVMNGATVTMWLQGEQGGPQFMTTSTQLAL